MADKKYNYKTGGNPLKMVSNGDGTYSISVFLDDDFKNKNSPLYISKQPELLNIPTYDGSNLATHPSVLSFRTPWNGYEYWMAFTPYPSTQHENPSIVASNDGINWVVPSGLTNPLDPTPTTGYNSDTELVRVGDNLRIYWRWYTDDEVTDNKLYYMESNDGINWTSKQACTFDIFNDPISPCIVRTDKWYMFTGAGSSPMKRYESVNGIDWSSPIDCKTNIDKVGRLWHPMVWADKNKFRMVCAISSLGDGPATNTELFYGWSEDGENWHIEDVSIWRRSPNQLFDERVYRSCVVPFSGENNQEMLIYMSGLTTNYSERIGYAKVKYND
jgi:hypothetical protein